MHDPDWTGADDKTIELLKSFETSEAGASGFASEFVVADPNFAVVVRREQMLAALPARRALFDRTGVGPTRCIGARQSRLDERHLLIRAEWQADRAIGPALHLRTTFLARREAADLLILAYLNHDDIEMLLTGERGDHRPRPDSGTP